MFLAIFEVVLPLQLTFGGMMKVKILPQMFKRASHFKFTKILHMHQYTAKFAKLVLNETFGSYLSKKQLPYQN
jgi:hypothetical protein